MAAYSCRRARGVGAGASCGCARTSRLSPRRWDTGRRCWRLGRGAIFTASNADGVEFCRRCWRWRAWLPLIWGGLDNMAHSKRSGRTGFETVVVAMSAHVTASNPGPRVAERAHLRRHKPAGLAMNLRRRPLWMQTLQTGRLRWRSSLFRRSGRPDGQLVCLRACGRWLMQTTAMMFSNGVVCDGMPVSGNGYQQMSLAKSMEPAWWFALLGCPKMASETLMVALKFVFLGPISPLSGQLQSALKDRRVSLVVAHRAPPFHPRRHPSR